MGFFKRTENSLNQHIKLKHTEFWNMIKTNKGNAHININDEMYFNGKIFKLRDDLN
jgi:hypothetical protein